MSCTTRVLDGLLTFEGLTPDIAECTLQVRTIAAGTRDCRDAGELADRFAGGFQNSTGFGKRTFEKERGEGAVNVAAGNGCVPRSPARDSSLC